MINLVVDTKLLENIEMVIFDKDGTLFELYQYWAGMAMLRAKAIAEYFNLSESIRTHLVAIMGVDVLRRKIKPDGPIGKKSRDEVIGTIVQYLNEFLSIDTYIGCEKSFQIADDRSLSCLNDLLKPLPGMEILIKSLVASGVKIGIATMDKKDRAVLCMEQAGLNEYITAYAGSDSVKNSKPSADMAVLLLKQCEVDAQRCVIIGDGIKDILMGYNSRLKAQIAVATGSTSARELYEYTSLVIESLEDVSVRFSLALTH